MQKLVSGQQGVGFRAEILILQFESGGSHEPEILLPPVASFTGGRHARTIAFSPVIDAQD